MVLSKLANWVRAEFSELIPLRDFIISVLSAAVIIAIGVLAGRLLGKFVGKTIRRLHLHKATQFFGLKIPPDVVGEFGTRYVIYFVAAIAALNWIGITTWVMNIIVTIIFIIILIALTLGLKDFIPNLIAGIMIFSRQTIKVGQHIKAGTTEGVVKEVGLFETKIETHSKNIIIIPNAFLVKHKIVRRGT